MNYNFLYRFYRLHRKLILIFITVVTIIIPIESIGFSKYTSQIISQLKQNSIHFSEIKYSIIAIIVIYFIINLLKSIQWYLDTKLDSYILQFSRNDLFNTFINKFSHEYQNIELGKISTYLNKIPHIYQDLIYRILKYIIPYSLGILIINIYFYTINYRLGILITILLLIQVLIISHNVYKCIHQSILNNKILSNNNEKIQDSLSNIYNVIVNNKEEAEKQTNKEREKTYNKQVLLLNYQFYSLDTLLNITCFIFLIIALYTYYHLFKKNKDKTHLITSFLVVFSLLRYIDRVRWTYIDTINNIGVIADFEEKFAINNKKKGQMNIKFPLTEIVFKNISFGYKKNKLIHKNLNFKLNGNKINIIIGDSGSGKSTIIKLLLGLLKCQSGHILYNNIDIQKISLINLRHHISSVNQDTKLFNESIFYNIQYGNSILDINTIINTINTFGYDNIITNSIDGLHKKCGVSGTNMSQGQRQIILILRVYFQKKPILILDEPTNGLDNMTKKKVLNHIKQIKNTTIIIVTHDKVSMNISENTIRLEIQDKME